MEGPASPTPTTSLSQPKTSYPNIATKHDQPSKLGPAPATSGPKARATLAWGKAPGPRPPKYLRAEGPTPGEGGNAPQPTTPLCPHFGPCGGCQLQHLTYPAQLHQKETRLLTLLAEAGITPRPSQSHTAAPWHYRNRIRLRLEPTGDRFLIGYNHHATNTFLPIHTCPIAAPLLLRTALTLATLNHPDALPWLRSTAELELFTLPDESRLQLTLHLRGGPVVPLEQQTRSFTRLCEALHHHIPELAGAGATLLRPHHTNSTRTHAPRRSAFAPTAWAAPGLLYPIPIPAPQPHTEQLWVSRPSFFQVNRHLIPTLVRLATTSAVRHDQRPTNHEPRLLWDLFAGVGLFTRALAPFATHITAVESSSTATADLAAARLPNCRIVTSTVLDFLRSAVLDRDRPDLVLLDPPRAGLGLEATALLTRVAPTRIVYVSCDPASLSRDLRAMLSSGYNLAELHLVDLFPQTVHLETVAVLDRI